MPKCLHLGVLLIKNNSLLILSDTEGSKLNAQTIVEKSSVPQDYYLHNSRGQVCSHILNPDILVKTLETKHCYFQWLA